MKIEQIPSVQSYLPIDSILDKGVIKLKDSSYIKILEVTPINYNLKSDLEKEAILNSYKTVFKSLNFNLQILIQSKKEDLTENIKILNSNLDQTEEINKIKEEYISYIQELNKIKKSSSKNFYIILKDSTSEKGEKIKIENLNNNYKKIRDLLSRCGNVVSEYTEEKEIVEILCSFLNSNK